jgi:hypothetical protein
MNNFIGDTDIPRKQCPVCGKKFNPAPEHAYYIGKNRKNFCCSYTCMRNNEKHKTVVPINKKPKYGTAVRIVETGETFRSIKQCAEHLDVYYSSVRKAVINGYTCKGYHIEAVEEGDAG